MSNYQSIETKIIDATGLNIDEIGGGGERGWQPNWGQEVITKYMLPRVNTDDVVVDLCSGDGRASMLFSMMGIKVVAVDISERNIAYGDMLRSKADSREVDSVIKDIKDLESESLDSKPTIILASDALIHFSKKEADEIIKKIPTLLDPSKRGLVYINVPSTDSYMFTYPEAHGADRFDERTLVVECACTGEYKNEFIPFYNKGELQAMLALQGGNIIATNEIERVPGMPLNEVIAEFKPVQDNN